ncbi:paraquat-inducible protein A [Salinisphaera sp. Q1T1-3]|uniref:paraquat-inducible protein A n=1 Tax=Salinisphaera sp. Q1T1-3 TaxID=2321229 RepID=UPI00131403AE|nr:paraquat-inducible protein A [Salinisphaera sp. Q1T1-3]
MTTSISTNADADRDDRRQRLVVCRECDWVVALPHRALGQRAECPRCHHHLTGAAQRDTQQPLAWALATLIVLALVFVFPFLGFSTRGVGHVMSFIDTVHALSADDYGLIAALLMATTVVFPGIYLASLAYIAIAAQWRLALPRRIALARVMRPIEPWMMSDVFIVGVLVSLIKIISLADIHMHGGFVAFCLYSALLLRTTTLIDWTALWDRLVPRPALPAHIRSAATGRSQALIACGGCDTPYVRAEHEHCPRCGKKARAPHIDRVQMTAALLLTATVLYIPANLYPVLVTVQLGTAQPQTIAAGVLHLAAHGDWPIALVIFLASIVVPIAKILALAWLCIATRRPQAEASLGRTRLFRITEKIGRWSMIDVFVVAVLATLVQAGSLMSIQPGLGVVAFAAVVILTMIAAHTFDTRLLWPTHSTHSTPEQNTC